MTLTDAGLETVLLFEEGVELPCFAAFPLLDSDGGRAVLRRYYEPFLRLARDRGAEFVLSSPTWRANPDWGEELGYDAAALEAVNRRAVSFLEETRDEVLAPGERDRVLIEGCVGPRSDAYRPTLRMWLERDDARVRETLVERQRGLADIRTDIEDRSDGRGPGSSQTVDVEPRLLAVRARRDLPHVEVEPTQRQPEATLGEQFGPGQTHDRKATLRGVLRASSAIYRGSGSERTAGRRPGTRFCSASSRSASSSRCSS